MQHLQHIIKDMGIITRDNLVAMEIKLDKNILKLIYNLSSALNVDEGDTFNIIIQGSYVEIIIDHDKIREVTRLIPKGYIQAIRKDLSEIIFLLTRKSSDSQRLFNEIYNEIMDSSIDIVQTISTNSNFTILVDKYDFEKVNKLINIS